MWTCLVRITEVCLLRTLLRCRSQCQREPRGSLNCTPMLLTATHDNGAPAGWPWVRWHQYRSPVRQPAAPRSRPTRSCRSRRTLRRTLGRWHRPSTPQVAQTGDRRRSRLLDWLLQPAAAAAAGCGVSARKYEDHKQTVLERQVLLALAARCYGSHVRVLIACTVRILTAMVPMQAMRHRTGVPFSASHPDAQPEADALEDALRHRLGRRVGRIAARKLGRRVAAEGQFPELRQRFAWSTRSQTCADHARIDFLGRIECLGARMLARHDEPISLTSPLCACTSTRSSPHPKAR